MTTVPEATPAARAAPARARRLRLPLIAALALAFVSLSLLSGVAYIVVLAGATGTAERLLVDRAQRVVEGQVAVVKAKLDPVTEQLELIAALAAAGRIDITSPVAVREALAVMMSRVPGVYAAGFGTLDLQLHRAVRRPDGSMVRETIPLASARNVERLHQLQTRHDTFWGALFWSEELKQPVLNVRTPVRRADNAFIGGLIATVSVGDLSYLIGDADQPTRGHYFIVVDGDRVLAHYSMVDAKALGLSEDRPLPTVKEVGDPVLAKFLDKPVRSPQIDRALGALGHVVEAEGRRWVFVYKELEGYGPKPWLVGQYFPIEEATADLDRLRNGAMVAGGTLAVALLLALIMGVRMARSIRTITSAAEAMERLEFEQLPTRRPSMLREIDDAANSLEKARAALKWFGAYVPQSLVIRLMELGDDGFASRRRDVTVMFTDIVEFTPQAEDLPERDTAELLNHHFALLGACIDREQGMIDKYIGDAVMAVWGALHRMDDHADRAIRAALAIARAIREDNALARAAGHAPVRTRIGLHTGRVVVGNIGAPGRVNFTVVGDAVNVAQRFEQLGKEFLKPDEEVVVLASGATIAAIVDRASLGIELPKPELHHVKGHDEPVEVYRLV